MAEIRTTIKVNNVPEYASEYDYIVCTLVDGELWFYGAYDDFARANMAAHEGNRVIIEN